MEVAWKLAVAAAVVVRDVMAVEAEDEEAVAAVDEVVEHLRQLVQPRREANSHSASSMRHFGAC